MHEEKKFQKYPNSFFSKNDQLFNKKHCFSGKDVGGKQQTPLNTFSNKLKEILWLMLVEFKDIPTYKIKDLFMANNTKKGNNMKNLRIVISHHNSKKSIIIWIHFKL